MNLLMGWEFGGLMKGKSMIEVKEAVSAASKAVNDFYSGQELKGVLLEEVDFDEGLSCWLITLGFSVPEPTTAPNTIAEALGGKRLERKYKTFEVDAESGEVRSMKIRTP